jgi:hypothetical protein
MFQQKPVSVATPFGCPNDLYVWSDGDLCGSHGQVVYTGPREVGQLVGGTAEDFRLPYERWELWRL